MPPFFTIITSTYNAADTLPHLLDSLASQTCRDFNWIVQDGASSDATMQIVEQYRDRLPEILADSSKDSGIYEAWNKAIDRWQDKMGEWVLFLGADDTLYDSQVLEKVKNKLSGISKSILFASGDMNLVDLAGEIISTRKVTNSYTTFKRRTYRMPVNHPAFFTRKEIIVKYRFDTSFKISGDYEFLIRSWQNHIQMVPLEILVTCMSVGGISSREYSRYLNINENIKIFKRYKFIKGYIWCLDSYIYTYKILTKSVLMKNKLGKIVWSYLKALKNTILP